MEITQKPCLHQEWINRNALEIVRVLQAKGFMTYLVGGCVRDLLLSKHPKDYDIATEAQPRDVKRSLRNAYIVGKRFRLVLVKRGNQQFEVATFRRDLDKNKELPDSVPEGDNLFGSPEQDANRRDFTINGLLYDPIDNKLIDYCGGLEDLKENMVRMIGEPDKRLKEDPIRILRGIRLAHLIRFVIEPSLRLSMQKNAASLLETALPRRREEFLKFLRLDNPSYPFIESYDLGLLKYTLPHLHEVFSDKDTAYLFTHYLNHFHEKPLDLQNPVELFGTLMLAYYRTMINNDPFKPVSPSHILDNSDMMSLMKDELGMFKFEQIMLAKALHMQSSLRKLSEFEHRGKQRQLALLQAEAFPLALQFANRDYSLSGEGWLFWSQQYEKFHNKIYQSHQLKSRPNRRRAKKKSAVQKKQKTTSNLAINQSKTRSHKR